MATQLHGIGELVKRLEKIAAECGEALQKEAGPADEFLRAKQRMYLLLEETRDAIHERETLMQKRGNCFESIQKGQKIRSHLDELNKLYLKLQELHKRSQGKRLQTVARKEEHQARYKDIRVLKKHTDEVKELFNRCSSCSHGDALAAAPGGPDATVFGLRGLAKASEASHRLLSADEQDALDHMKKRDQEIDRQVGELGSIVERLDPLAREIGSAADRQRLKAEAITADVQNTEKDIESLNKKISEVIKYEKNTNCCCQIVLLVALLCCLGFILQHLKL